MFLSCWCHSNDMLLVFWFSKCGCFPGNWPVGRKAGGKWEYVRNCIAKVVVNSPSLGSRVTKFSREEKLSNFLGQKRKKKIPSLGSSELLCVLCKSLCDVSIVFSMQIWCHWFLSSVRLGFASKSWLLCLLNPRQRPEKHLDLFLEWGTWMTFQTQR